MLTQRLVKELFEYRNGCLYWKIQKSNSVFKGKQAGFLENTGYRRIRINNTNYLEHKVIFLYHKGYMPCCVDHININKLDNRIENLREVNFSENSRNQKIRCNNKSGIKGVCWNKKSNKWQASLTINRKQMHLGYFNNLEDAKIVIDKAREKYHGEFARHG